jgi:uncharacterized Ntn-hydrolase superfamily protein
MGVVARNGERVLSALADGAEPVEALDQALAVDPHPELRQIGVVAADGRAAAHTGTGCVAWAGHLAETGLAVQGNMLVNAQVLPAMQDAFLDANGSLAERMMMALEAGQAAGGDRRGQQAAALVVEQSGAAERIREGIDRLCDLRVDDHPEPIAELRRLLTLWQQRQAERGA